MVVRNIPEEEWDSEPGDTPTNDVHPVPWSLYQPGNLGFVIRTDVQRDALEQPTGLEEEA